MNKIISALALLLCVPLAGNASGKKDNSYLKELKAFKKAAEYEIMFSDDANGGLVQIQKSLEIDKELSFLQRLARLMFFMCDPVVVTAHNMPKMHAYVDGLCKKANIATPTIFITADKHGFFNAAAAKLFATTGGIIIGQKMIYETTESELEAIIAHEIGHIKHNHLNKIIALKLATCFGAQLFTNLAIEGYRKITHTDKMGYTNNQETLKAWVPVLATIFGPHFIINKRFEKEADRFAFENDRAQGVAEFFQDVIDREAKYDKDFDTIAARLQEGKSKIACYDYFFLNVAYYLSKSGNYMDKVFRYIYHHTPLGDHPSHEARIKAAQDYLAQQSDWNASQI